MELKIPPVVVFLFFGFVMTLVAKYLPFGSFDFFGSTYLFRGLIGLAVIVSVVALFQFYKSKTTIDPSKPLETSHLVTNGVYTFSRNPMYLAMLLLLLAAGVVLGNAFNTLVAAGFVAYMNRFQIIPEERVLLQKFGKAYKEYCTLTRRWF
ncbi:MAG: isoprenylcysteine carboxylmethyltransferase family protein [Maribacter sp.]